MADSAWYTVTEGGGAVRSPDVSDRPDAADVSDVSDVSERELAKAGTVCIADRAAMAPTSDLLDRKPG
ncbi:hypothetical protein B1H18_29000 [Streptomyces tsukubensis]|uniref:Uncharacterized protein n=1 Tax=Streptomyces tsukubensis TaxID=83656 RepID=A0A1V4A1T4_9ACTN|nr:hypothetical protein B1H18_29000 [Streptomyces tsukubensis]